MPPRNRAGGRAEMHPIARYRLGRGITQAELAKLMDAADTSVQNWERGIGPRPRSMPKLAEFLAVEPQQLANEIVAWRSATEA